MQRQGLLVRLVVALVLIQYPVHGAYWEKDAQEMLESLNDVRHSKGASDMQKVVS